MAERSRASQSDIIGPCSSSRVRIPVFTSIFGINLRDRSFEFGKGDKNAHAWNLFVLRMGETSIFRTGRRPIWVMTYA